MNRNRKKILVFITLVVTILGFIVVMNRQKRTPEDQYQSTNDAQKKFLETKKALMMLSTNINIGMESVKHIEEYEKAKSKIFKKQIPKK
jgi:flagellar biosynthesis/type III secretory pathway M-ring protein FliF/YscJ